MLPIRNIVPFSPAVRPVLERASIVRPAFRFARTPFDIRFDVPLIIAHRLVVVTDWLIFTGRLMLRMRLCSIRMLHAGARWVRMRHIRVLPIGMDGLSCLGLRTLLILRLRCIYWFWKLRFILRQAVFQLIRCFSYSGLDRFRHDGRLFHYRRHGSRRPRLHKLFLYLFGR